MRAVPGDRDAVDPGRATVSLLVRSAFLVRLIALGFAALVMVLERDTAVLPLAFLTALAVTSHLGLQRPGIREAVVRHPSLALPDVVLVCLVPLAVGERSPLLLVGVSSALLVGVLFTPRTSIPLALALATCFGVAGGAVADGALEDALSFPVVLLSVTAAAVAFRRLADEQQRAEAAAAQARAASAAAQERLRLARDLHDTVAKSLQGLALTATALPAWLARDPARAAIAARDVVTGAREAVQASRHLLTSLRLDDPERPLHEVLDEVAARADDGRGVGVVRDLVPVQAPQPAVRHELVMAVSEALGNAGRHAPGARVVLRLRGDATEVQVTVRDDGPGLTDDRRRRAVEEGRFGLVGLSERMASVGGDVVVDSAPGAGTAVHLRVPVSVRAQSPVVVADPS